MKNNKKVRKQKRTKKEGRINRFINLLTGAFLFVLIRLGFQEQTTPEKVLARLRKHIEKLTDNIHFPVIAPTLAQMQTMVDLLKASIDKVAAGDLSEIPTRNNRVKAAKEMIRQLSYNIQYLSGGDEVKIKSAGFDVRKPKGSTQPPGQVLNLVAKATGPGKIKLRWKKDANATVYVVQMQPVMPNAPDWEDVGKTRNVSFVVKDLNPGQLYVFRVYATNGNTDGNPSDIAEQRSL